MGVDLMAGATVAASALGEGRAPRIAVFDSGLGGLTVFAEVARQLAGAELIYLADDAGFPYGRLGDAALVERVVLVMERLIERHRPDLVIIACNTASTLALPVLRARFSIPFVGTVPAIKPAAAVSASRRISVLATPGTVARDYTRELVAAHASDCVVTLVGAADLAAHAEAELRGEPVADAALAGAIAPCFVTDGEARTDVVVLACTHYPLLMPRLERLAPWPVVWIDPAAAIARRAAALVGTIDVSPSMPPRALFTLDRPCPQPLLQALLGRGFAEAAVEPLPPLMRTAPC
jgi:glutamate racemase